MKKLSLILSLTIILALTGCGSDNKQSSSDSSSPKIVEQTSKPNQKSPKDDINATTEQKNAVKRARSYVSTMYMSKSKIADQLVKFDRFSELDAEYAVNQLTDIDWNEVALKKAESYTQTVGIAKSKIANQLVQFEGFTQEEADYAVANIKADFKEIAARKAKNYYQDQNMSIEGVRNQMLSQFEGFTEEEVEYAVSKLQR